MRMSLAILLRLFRGLLLLVPLLLVPLLLVVPLRSLDLDDSEVCAAMSALGGRRRRRGFGPLLLGWWLRRRAAPAIPAAATTGPRHGFGQDSEDAT